MAVLVGVDGCRGGWLALIDLGHRDIRAWVFRSFLELIDAVPKSALISVDIPIGLPEKGPRHCDLEARRRLGKPRSNSVFSAPLRACLAAKSHEEAGRIRFKIEAKKMSLQAFGILPKIREVDELLRKDSRLARRVIEVHPEVSFAEWNRGKALKYAKRRAEGKAERCRLIEKVWPGVIEGIRERLQGEEYVRDDLYDAFAALWSIRRYAAKSARVLGGSAVDSRGLVMRIVA
jgi:predicted RNase H-like nuclease